MTVIRRPSCRTSSSRRRAITRRRRSACSMAARLNCRWWRS